MKKKIYFEPDYYRLNREAKAYKTGAGQLPGAAVMNRLLPNNKRPEPVTGDSKLFENISALLKSTEERINWEQDLFKASYVVFDVETTGLRPFKGDEIISLGAVTIENGAIMDRSAFQQLVNPRRPISSKAKEITGISDGMLRDKPEIMPVIKEFIEFCGPRILVAHNAPFDLAFLNLKLGETTGKRIINPVIDTVLLTAALYYHLENYSLENLSSRFGFSLEGRHDSLADARMTATLFLKLLPELKERGIMTLPQLAGLLSALDPGRGYPLIF